MMTKVAWLVEPDRDSEDMLRHWGYEVRPSLDKDASLAVFPGTGIDDVDPFLYGQKANKYVTHINGPRDQRLYGKIKEAILANIPILGICRGAQLLNIFNGGELIQHVEGHGSIDHFVVTSKGPFVSNSSHHQVMVPAPCCVDIIGVSNGVMSRAVGKDNVELNTEEIVEAEILYYPDTNCLCVQYHPEWMNFETKAVQFINQFIEEEMR